MVELGIGPGAGDPVTLGDSVPHDLDHVTEALLDVLATVTGGQASGERLDRPSELTELTTPSSRCGPKARHSMMSGSSRFQSLTGRTRVPTFGRALTRPWPQERAVTRARRCGDLETLADLLRHERAVGAQITGDDHLTQLLNELAVEAAAAACRAPSARPAQLGVGAAPGTNGCMLAGRRLRIGVAIEITRAGEAGVDGAGGGHHGVRKGTHASFVGAAQPPLEVFGEKHTKG